VAVGEGVSVGVRVAVAVRVGVRVSVTAGAVKVAVRVGIIGVMVLVAVRVAVGVRVDVGVKVGVGVGVSVGVRVGVRVGGMNWVGVASRVTVAGPSVGDGPMVSVTGAKTVLVAEGSTAGGVKVTVRAGMEVGRLTCGLGANARATKPAQ
jgi:hypothetical protein